MASGNAGGAKQVADRDARAVRHRGMEARTVGVVSLFYHPRVHVPMLGVDESARTMVAQRSGERLAKIPSAPVAVVIDDADFIESKAIQTVIRRGRTLHSR